MRRGRCCPSVYRAVVSNDSTSHHSLRDDWRAQSVASLVATGPTVERCGFVIYKTNHGQTKSPSAARTCVCCMGCAHATPLLYVAIFVTLVLPARFNLMHAWLLHIDQVLVQTHAIKKKKYVCHENFPLCPFFKFQSKFDSHV